MRGQLSARKQIRNLLILIGSAVFTAIFVALGLLHLYGPTGSYEAKYLMFSPEYFQTPQAGSSDWNTAGTFPFVFDKIEFHYYDASAQKWKDVAIGKERYEKFYALIANDTSYIEAPEEVQELFDTSENSSLVLSGQLSGKTGKDAQRKFQIIEFAKSGNDYRMELQNPSSQSKWVYFSHPGILKEALSALGDPTSAQ